MPSNRCTESLVRSSYEWWEHSSVTVQDSGGFMVGEGTSEVSLFARCTAPLCTLKRYTSVTIACFQWVACVRSILVWIRVHHCEQTDTDGWCNIKTVSGLTEQPQATKDKAPKVDSLLIWHREITGISFYTPHLYGSITSTSMKRWAVVKEIWSLTPSTTRPTSRDRKTI